ncbi:alpha/beta fold hydrolase [Oceanospirillum linum]|uniref:AB hydrolase-1 domain-containing protein n=1 Tax=Oceanospirillum linum TaxID=966 RepID=A0A1T1H952_OCELI|nr:alpha/beta hydrolase [Oceanospirillum linum]OOV86363.1 hypothetical protein BTA35_0214245 [Oceanospirillum linum]SEG48508.1 Pimeloyl-ACP methyl ester carboxylesterase [Oleiphilus messinensis]SMP31242.1 Pimeloyl-ACP methyl ester carboxylesterase [Oceanospirillum linum]
MSEHFQCETASLDRQDYRIFYRIYRNLHNPNGRKILMLHGAGVDGAFTWEPMLRHLSHWGTLLVPDLRGMGQSIPLPEGRVENAFTVEQVVCDVSAVLDYLGWFESDLAGYSFGGLVAMLLKQQRPSAFRKTYLLEPALLERPDLNEMRQVRGNYSVAAQMMRTEEPVEKGITHFLDLISPKRSKSARVEHATVHRLKNRVLGLSYALDAVTDAVQRLERSVIIQAQSDVVSFVGSKSLDSMKACHRQIAEQRNGWCYHEIGGTDHSLPFQKPSKIAEIVQRTIG